MSVQVVPQFVSGTTQRIFAVEFRPDRVKSRIVLVPPFAEEMNRSRLMLSRTARELANQGMHVLLPDLSGTGDSPGDFGDATWSCWKDDIRAVLEMFGSGDEGAVDVVAVRLGALLALAALRGAEFRVGRAVFWAPSLDGAAYLAQFLRLRTMSSLIGNTGAGESVADLKAVLQAGRSVEVAGYRLASSLYSAICGESAEALFDVIDFPVHWMEMLPDADARFPAGAARTIAAMTEKGLSVTQLGVVGPKFWSTVETTCSDALIRETAMALGGN